MLLSSDPNDSKIEIINGLWTCRLGDTVLWQSEILHVLFDEINLVLWKAGGDNCLESCRKQLEESATNGDRLRFSLYHIHVSDQAGLTSDFFKCTNLRGDWELLDKFRESTMGCRKTLAA